MADTAENPKIGLDSVYIARLLSDDGTNAPSYDTPIKLAGAVAASVNPNSSVETDYADNGAFFVTGNRANTEMSLELTNIDPDTLALMLGQTRANGITIEKPLDQSPYFAFGFRVWIGGTDSNGNKIFEYFWYAKGKFSVPESGGTTKKDSIDFQHVSLTAQFVQTLYQPDGNSGVICTHGRSDYGLSSAMISAWFNAPVVSTTVDTGAVTVAMAEGSTAGTIAITGTKAGGGSCVFAEATIVLGDTLIIADSNGAMVAGSVEVSSDTIVFTPTVAFQSADVLTVTATSGIKDVNGVSVTPKTDSVTIA